MKRRRSVASLSLTGDVLARQSRSDQDEVNVARHRKAILDVVQPATQHKVHIASVASDYGGQVTSFYLSSDSTEPQHAVAIRDAAKRALHPDIYKVEEVEYFEEVYARNLPGGMHKARKTLVVHAQAVLREMTRRRYWTVQLVKLFLLLLSLFSLYVLYALWTL